MGGATPKHCHFIMQALIHTKLCIIVGRRFFHRLEKQTLACRLASQDEQVLTRTGDVAGRWKEHFEELLNPGNTSSWQSLKTWGKSRSYPWQSWLTCLHTVSWRIGTGQVSAERRTRVVVPFFFKSWT